MRIDSDDISSSIIIAKLCAAGYNSDVINRYKNNRKQAYHSWFLARSSTMLSSVDVV